MVKCGKCLKEIPVWDSIWQRHGGDDTCSCKDSVPMVEYEKVMKYTKDAMTEISDLVRKRSKTPITDQEIRSLKTTIGCIFEVLCKTEKAKKTLIHEGRLNTNF
jgi:hypothetical protein